MLGVRSNCILAVGLSFVSRERGVDSQKCAERADDDDPGVLNLHLLRLFRVLYICPTVGTLVLLASGATMARNNDIEWPQELDRVGPRDIIASDPWLSLYVLPAAELQIMMGFARHQSFSNNVNNPGRQFPEYTPLAQTEVGLGGGGTGTRVMTRRMAQNARAAAGPGATPDRIGRSIGEMFLEKYIALSGQNPSYGTPAEFDPLTDDRTNSVKFIQRYDTYSRGTRRQIYHVIAITTTLGTPNVTRETILRSAPLTADVIMFTLSLATNPPLMYRTELRPPSPSQ